MPTPTALITGGTSGIGRATALVLHDRGFNVMVTGHNPDTVTRARAELPADIVIVTADARSLSDTDRVVEEIRTRFGGLTTLFLNAGITRPTPADTVDEASFDELFAVNTKGHFFTLQKTLPLLTDGASIVFTVGIGATGGVIAPPTKSPKPLHSSPPTAPPTSGLPPPSLVDTRARPDAVAGYRPSDRARAWYLARVGVATPDTLLGDVEPEPVARLYQAELAWLHHQSDT